MIRGKQGFSYGWKVEEILIEVMEDKSDAAETGL